MIDFLHHLILPRESNNHRARLLHLGPLFIVAAFLLTLVLIIPPVEKHYPQVLGISEHISIDELVNLTNQKRSEVGQPPLVLNPQLTQAAAKKADDMFTKNYWAHNAPDGVTPWVFIKSSGYEYLYAGENLARGYTTALDAINAWMASPGHKNNILSPNYKDVGFAIETGTLAGDDTVLIVEEFGSRLPSETAIASALIKTSEILPTSIPRVAIKPPLYIASAKREPFINKNFVTENITLFIASILILVFIVDMIVIERKKIVRFVSHNTDHILFLAAILLIIIILIYNKGDLVPAISTSIFN
jgi:hypothetical protein